MNSMSKNEFDTEVLSRIVDILKKIRTNKYLSELPTTNEPVNLITKKVYFKGRTVDALIITVTPTGCEWARSNGGCTMCGEFSGSMGGKTIESDYHILQFTKALANYFPKHKTPWLRIYNEGSFLNPNELGHDALSVIIRISSLLDGIKRITIESNPQYVTNKTLEILREGVEDRAEIEVGIGLEAQDDYIRNVCINKSLEKSEFERAVNLLHSYNMRALAYVLIKPPFLTERESLDEAIATVKYAFKIGFDAVKLEPVSIHGYSFIEALSMQGLYEPPWLWTVIEIIKKCNSLGEIRVGGVEYYPPPKSIAHNYHDNSNCSQFGWQAIRSYNQNHDPDVFDNFNCSCKDYWRQIVEQTPKMLLRDRVLYTINKLSLEQYFQSRQGQARQGSDSGNHQSFFSE